MSKQENERIYHECIYHIKEDKYKTHELDTGTNGKTHTLKRGTRSENKENENNADWSSDIFDGKFIWHRFIIIRFLAEIVLQKTRGRYISFMRHVGHS